MRDFYYSERDRHVALIEKTFFGQDRGNGFFKGERYGFVLRDGLNNLYEPIRRDALRYFEDNGVSWWGGKKPTGHVLSSQIACLNHLMLIRKEPEAVLALINGVRFLAALFARRLQMIEQKDQQRRHTHRQRHR